MHASTVDRIRLIQKQLPPLLFTIPHDQTAVLPSHTAPSPHSQIINSAYSHKLFASHNILPTAIHPAQPTSYTHNVNITRAVGERRSQRPGANHISILSRMVRLIKHRPWPPPYPPSFTANNRVVAPTCCTPRKTASTICSCSPAGPANSANRPPRHAFSATTCTTRSARRPG